MFISSVAYMETFKCDLFFATSLVLGALSQLSSLRNINFSYATGQREDVMGLRPAITHNSFLELTTFEFCSAYRDACEIMQMNSAPNLEKLFIHSTQLENTDILLRLLFVLSKHRPKLMHLSLDSVHDVEGPLRDVNGQETDRVTLDILTPLLSFPLLQRIRVAYHRPFQLSNADMEKLVGSWPNMVDISLCADPFLEEPPMLTVAVLPIVAKHCPRLRLLRLYLDTRSVFPKFSLQGAADRCRFASLGYADFGTSPLAEEDIFNFSFDIGKSLSHACTLVSPRVYWCDLGGAFQIDDKTLERWGKARSMVKMFALARKEERFHIRSRTRNAVEGAPTSN
ncbi:hypothetical protein ACEPAG_2624 [Sanghuangporus baumii]